MGPDHRDTAGRDGRTTRDRDRATGSVRALRARALLASLPATEVVTTNYDTLFERSTVATGRRFAVLPCDTPSREDDGWLLELHGSVDGGRHDIVLTWGDYFRYADRRAALAGIVQALLITRSMLFVGFSLRDETFLRIANSGRVSSTASRSVHVT